MNENILLGGFRIRQIRVVKEKCQVLKSLSMDCYSRDMSRQNKSTLSNFLLPIVWQSSSQTNDYISYWGELATYPGSGLVIDVTKNRTFANLLINNLRNQRFIDRSTRVLFVDFNTFNPTLNMHAGINCILKSNIYL